MTRRQLTRLLPLAGLVILVALVAAACVAPGGTPAPGAPSPTPVPPLQPAEPGANPVDLLAWLFTPVFQILFIALVVIDQATGDIGIAIIVVTIILRTLLVPVFRKQIVSMRRTQLLQPELREIQRRYKGDRQRLSQAQMELYKERGVNPASGCLPMLIQLPLLMAVYVVITTGLTNPDPTAMLNVFGYQIPVECVNGLGTPAYDPYVPCLDTTVAWLGGLDVSKPQVLFPLPLIGGLSILALIAAFLQLIQSRMTMPPTDPSYSDQSSRTQRQLVLFLPLISIVYGGFLPAGLFIYWILTSLFAIVQQYLIVGWGSMFPIFGWTPGFAKDHTPRFPVAAPTLHTPSSPGGKPGAPVTPGQPTDRTAAQRAASAASTVRPRERGRQGRRGRKR
ncbi:MAG: 60 kDa inner rane insertion protein [Chloroflexi bacterium]|nr:60 kDa inner rane insertion protein [Chloroflexota bacterium]